MHVSMRPGNRPPAVNSRPLSVRTAGRVALEQRCVVEHARDVLVRGAPIYRDVHAVVAEVVGDCQALDAPPGAQAVDGEVHAPIVAGAGRLQRNALGWAVACLCCHLRNAAVDVGRASRAEMKRNYAPLPAPVRLSMGCRRSVACPLGHFRGRSSSCLRFASGGPPA